MKRLIALLASTIFVVGLTFMTIAPVLAADSKDTEEKVYKDEDLKQKMDEDKSTLNQMESEQGSLEPEGSAAGGVRGDEGKMKSEGDEYKGDVEKTPDMPQKAPDKPYNKW